MSEANLCLTNSSISSSDELGLDADEAASSELRYCLGGISLATGRSIGFFPLTTALGGVFSTVGDLLPSMGIRRARLIGPFEDARLLDLMGS